MASLKGEHLTPKNWAQEHAPQCVVDLFPMHFVEKNEYP